MQEYLPLIQKFEYKKGSLSSNTFNPSSKDSIIPLPPIQERAFMESDIGTIHSVLEPILNEEFQLLLLYTYTKALLQGDNVLGGEGSRHSRSSLIKAYHPTKHEFMLAKIEFFALCTCIIKSNNSQLREWVAFVNWFDGHMCKAWFSYPTEVWSTYSFESSYIPLQSVHSTVVFTKQLYDFGQTIGQDKCFYYCANSVV